MGGWKCECEGLEIECFFLAFFWRNAMGVLIMMLVFMYTWFGKCQLLAGICLR